MRIQGHAPVGSHEISRTTPSSTPSTRPTETRLVSGEDTVDLSATRTGLAELTQQAQSTPDVRMDRVEEIRGQLESGSYAIDAEAIADRLIDSMLS